MSKPASAETMLRKLRAEEKLLRKVNADLTQECAVYRARASKAEQRAAAWESRFDALLNALPAAIAAATGAQP